MLLRKHDIHEHRLKNDLLMAKKYGDSHQILETTLIYLKNKIKIYNNLTWISQELDKADSLQILSN